MRSSRWLLLLLLAGMAALNLWVTFARSTIPLDVHGEVTEVDLRFEKHRGVDDVYLVTVGGRTIHVDTAIGRRIREGDHLSKDAWTRALHTPRGTLELGPSRDLERMMVVMPVVVLTGVVVARRRRDP